MLHHLTLIALLALSGNLLAQEVVIEELTQYTPTFLIHNGPIAIDIEGTYQVLLKDNRMVEPEISGSMLDLISEKRKQDQVVYIIIDKYMTIKVLPHNVIGALDFIPPDKYVYED